MLSGWKFPWKKGSYSRIFIVILLCVDILSFDLAFRAVSLHLPTLPLPLFAPFVFIGALTWIVIAFCSRLLESGAIGSVKNIVRSHGQALPMLLLIQLTIFLLMGIPKAALFPLLMVNGYGLLFTVVIKSGMLLLYQQWHWHQRIRYIIIGHTSAGQQLHQYLQKHKHYIYQFMGFFDDTHDPNNLHSKVEDVYLFCKAHKIDQMYLALPENPDLIKQLSAFADDHFIYFGHVVEKQPLQEKLILLPNTDITPLPI